MKKIFIFLFAVFLITFMGCQTGFGGSSEILNSETTEETTGKTTVETDGKPVEETFEVFALDDDDNILCENGNEIGIEKINAEFNLGKTDESNFVYRYFYERIKINNTVYTIKMSITETDNPVIVKGNNNIAILYGGDHEYRFDSKLNYLDFKDFYMGDPIYFAGAVEVDEAEIIMANTNEIPIFFSDLYEEVK